VTVTYSNQLNYRTVKGFAHFWGEWCRFLFFDDAKVQLFLLLPNFFMIIFQKKPKKCKKIGFWDKNTLKMAFLAAFIP
jgi:hypothetical protein